jgi:two-component system sensor histidine kinase BaeS
MHRQVLQLSKLVDDLHDLARADAGALAFHKVPVDLTMMIEESLAAFSARYATKNICYHMDFVPRKGAVLTADPDRLRQLFSNLIENSLRYTDNDGELRISLRRAEDLYTLTFEDSAPGVSAQQRPMTAARREARVQPFSFRETFRCPRTRQPTL